MEFISLSVVRMWMEESSPVLVSGHFLRISPVSDRRVSRVWRRSWSDCCVSTYAFVPLSISVDEVDFSGFAIAIITYYLL